jgi:predicted flap endonuclease-1-like 5' DNA nuclease
MQEDVEVKEQTKADVIEEVSEVAEETNKPMLFTEVPATGQDKLSALKGLGPTLEKKLNILGIYTFEQIASWTLEQEAWVGKQVAFPNKVTKEEWVKQAKEILNAK